MSGYISISDVLKVMRLGRKADITLCAYDKNRKTGGERVSYKDVVLREAAAVRPAVSGIVAAPAINSKNPHHRFNKTVNIQTVSGDIISIHPVLIEEFNGQRVVL